MMNTRRFPEGNREWVTKLDWPVNPAPLGGNLQPDRNLKRWQRGLLTRCNVWWR